MNIRELIEGVVPKGDVALTAYLITVAETYAAAPVHDKAAEQHWGALNKSTMGVLMKRLAGSRIKVTYTATDPYATFTNDPLMMVRYMLYDMVVFNQLVIYTGDSQHPYFTEEQNVAFRAVHDFFAHGKIRTTFFKQLQDAVKAMKLTKLPPIDEAGPLLAKIDISRYGNRGMLFNGRGELNAASEHIRLAPRAAAPALFTEVVGQVSSQIITGKFGVQKVAVLPGFDYNKIGVCLPGSAQDVRMKEIMAQIEQGAETIKSTLGALHTQEMMRRAKNGLA